MDLTDFQTLARDFCAAAGRLVVLTGAGVSAESGIPTFRGSDGYWTVGSQRYQPQTLATRAMFAREPAHVWAFYLERMAGCRTARPNPGHAAIAELDRRLADRFRLITQNVDGLHLLAGNDSARTYQIHGNLRMVRCFAECQRDPWPLDLAALDLDSLEQDSLEQEPSGFTRLTPDRLEKLHCPACGAWLRPHVLWFDEYYDEYYYRSETALESARRADLLLVVGTSGATSLPALIVQEAARRGCPIVELNPERTALSPLADATSGGHLSGSAATVLPQLLAPLTEAGPRAH